MNKEKITETILSIPVGESATIQLSDTKTRDYVRNKCHSLNRKMGRRTFSFSDRGDHAVVTRNNILDRATMLDKLREMKPGEVMHLHYGAYDSLRAMYHEGISVRLVVEVEKK